MIKKKIAILFLLVFSLGFTAQYSTTKGKNVKMSQQEMDKNAAEIVELLKFLDMDEVKQSTIREVKEDMKRKIGEGEYIKKYGEMPEISKVKNSSKAEQKKVMDRLDSVAKEVIKNNIRNKKVNYNFLNGKLKVVKTSDGWKVKG